MLFSVKYNALADRCPDGVCDWERKSTHPFVFRVINVSVPGRLKQGKHVKILQFFFKESAFVSRSCGCICTFVYEKFISDIQNVYVLEGHDVTLLYSYVHINKINFIFGHVRELVTKEIFRSCNLLSFVCRWKYLHYMAA